MTHFQGPGNEESKWQIIVPDFENTTIDIQINLKEITRIQIHIVKSLIGSELEKEMKTRIMEIHELSINKYKYWIRICFIFTFICFLGMIGYPFINVFLLLIPSKHNKKLLIIYSILLIVIEIVIVILYYKFHHTGHYLEHKAICFYISELSKWIDSGWDRNINLIYPKQILNVRLIDHGKPLYIYICLTENDKAIGYHGIENEENVQITMIIVTSSTGHDTNKSTTNCNISTPLL